MSFGMVAASYLATSLGGLLQQNTGTWSGTNMSVSLPNPTNVGSAIVLIVAGDTTIPTPGGWTLRESQVGYMGHYLFTCSGGSDSWNVSTSNSFGTWYVAEIGNATYGNGASANESWDYGEYATPSLVPPAGNCLLLASIASVTDTNAIRTTSGWTSGFSEVADVCNPANDYPMQGVSTLSMTADGVVSVMTAATFSSLSTGRSAIIASFIL